MIALQSTGLIRMPSNGESPTSLVDFESKSTPSILTIGHFGELKFDAVHPISFNKKFNEGIYLVNWKHFGFQSWTKFQLEPNPEQRQRN